MKKTSLLLTYLLVFTFLITSFSGLGKTSEIALNKNFSGIWKARIPKPISSSSTSSSGGECILCIQVVPECSSNQILVPQSCTECAHCIDSSSSGGLITRKPLAHINEGFAGSRIITLKLCVKNGRLEGTIHQKDVFDNANITSQNIISENEVEINAKSKDGKIAIIHLKLAGDRHFTGKFLDGHEFKGKKLNNNKGCLA